MPEEIGVFAANDSHTRYILVTSDAPVITNIHGLIPAFEDEAIEQILLLTGDGLTGAVEVAPDVDGDVTTYSVYELDPAGRLFEEIQFDGEDNVISHEVFVNGFTTDVVPSFTAHAV